MTKTTNLFEGQLVERMIEKHRDLVESYPPKKRILGVNRDRLKQMLKTTSEEHTKELAASIIVSPH
jgi:hypothetical protein